ncbi:MAG: hypothetical protein R6U91_04095 [Bacillota bacterium]
MPLGSAIILVVIIGGLLFLAVWLSRYKMNKAVKQVIKIFREKGALDPGSANFRKELGLLSLREQSFVDRAFKPRDYKVMENIIFRSKPCNLLKLRRSFNPHQD